MKKLLLIPGIVLILTGCMRTEASLKEELAKANHCEVAEDCTLIGSKCPFDCYIYVHKDEADKMKAKVDAYETTCMYSCIASRGVECREKKCVVLTEGPSAEDTEETGNVGAACTSDNECVTPMSYLTRSSCPFTSMCIDGECAVVCPEHNPDADAEVGDSYRVSCEADSDCNCDYPGSGASRCACVSNQCVSVME